MSTVTDLDPAAIAAAATKLSRRPRTPHRGAGTIIPAQSTAAGPARISEQSRTSEPEGAAETAGTETAGTAVTRTVARKAVVARKTVSLLTTAMVAVAIAAFLLLAVGPRILGYQTSTMLTGSMAPLINPGDVVVTAPMPVSDIQVGDVITYLIPVEDHRVETHRVVEVIANADGTTAVRTKGDANNGVDPWMATLQGATVDRHIFTVPVVGHAIRALREPVVLNTLMYGAPALLVIGLLGTIWRKDPEPASDG